MMNVLMTHLHVAEHCPRRQVKVTISLSLPVTVRYSAIVFLRGVASPIADQPGTESDWAITELTVTCCTLLIATFSILRFLSRGIHYWRLAATDWRRGTCGRPQLVGSCG